MVIQCSYFVFLLQGVAQCVGYIYLYHIYVKYLNNENRLPGLNIIQLVAACGRGNTARTAMDRGGGGAGHGRGRAAPPTPALEGVGRDEGAAVLAAKRVEAMAREATAVLLWFSGFKAYEKWEHSIDNIVGDACTILLLFGSAKKSSSQKQT
ncbi:uncharacterized protein [Miscanthus floridulus]|uniref:uncharacterized protein isoform X2 n=1 Tax=Miscanthus floridulus TaxID=154761 RepID=UPI0034589A96